MHLKNLDNEYAAKLGALYDKIPKAVLAAIAVSLATHGGDDLAHARELILEEWGVLHQQGIVPQKPSRFTPGHAARAKER